MGMRDRAMTSTDGGFTEPTGAPALSGSIRVRVRYCECDPMGVVHHASFVPWLEMGRTELLRASGVSYAALEAAGVFLVVTKLDVRYRRPVRYDDVVEVRTRVESASRIKIRHVYEVALAERGGRAAHELDPASDPSLPTPDASGLGVCVAATTELACVGADGRPRALPGWLGGEG